MSLDMMAPSTMLERDIHHRKNYPFVYYCEKCNRSYVSKKRIEACKFCQNNIRLLIGEKKYIYFCERCDRRIESDEPKMACGTCGNKILTLYRWDMLESREKRGIQIARFMKELHYLPNILKQKNKILKQKNKIKEREIQSALISAKALKKEGKIKGEELPSEQLTTI